MTPGSRLRRIARRTAGGAVAALALVLAGGCHGGPLARVAATPNRPQSTLGAVGRTLGAATVALDVPSELAAIDPSNSARGTVTPASAIGSSPRADLISTELPTGRSAVEPVPSPPTPLLDEALTRARRRGEVPDPADPAALANLPQPAPPLPPTVEPALAVAAAPAPVIVIPDTKPAPEPAAPTPPEPAAPEELWRDGVRKLVGLARSRHEQAGTGTGTGTGATEPWGLRARVLAWLAEPDIDPDLGQREADTVRSVLRALQATAAGDPQARGDDVRTAVQTLEARAPLELVDLRLCSEVKRFGDFTPFDPPARRAGDWVVIYCEVDGLHHEPTPGGFRTQLAGHLEINPEGGGPALALPLRSAEEVFPRRRRDYYIAYLTQIPRDLAPGQYTVRVSLKDVLADRTAGRGMPLTIVTGRDREAETPRELTPAP